MRDSLFSAIVAWWRSRRAYDAVGSASALLRSPAVQAAAADLPKLNRCPGKGRACASFVKAPGLLCHRCDPDLIARERMEREQRNRREIAAGRVVSLKRRRP